MGMGRKAELKMLMELTTGKRIEKRQKAKSKAGWRVKKW
jgi:hypothetical protein